MTAKAEVPQRRKNDRIKSRVIPLLVACIFLVFSTLGYVTFRQVGETETNALRIELAVCSVIDYASTQARNLQSTNRRASRELRDLASNMRDTGIRCSQIIMNRRSR